jgi:tetratricopeptide (TPR) repeat protein
MKHPWTLIAAACLLTALCSGCGRYAAAPADPLADERPPAAHLTRELPGNALFHFLSSQRERQAGRTDQAILDLRTAIEMDPASTYLRRELAALYLQNKEEEKALAAIEELLRREPDDVKGLIFLGGIRQMRKESAEAIAAYEKVVGLDPSQERIFSLLAGMHLEAGNLDEAQEVLNRLNARFPRSYAGHFLLGRLHLLREELPQAEAAFRRCAEIEPASPDPLFELLKIYQLRKSPAETEKVVREILERDPENVRAALELAVLMHASGMTAEAEILLRRLGERSRAEFDVVLHLAQGFVEPKKMEEALFLIDGMLSAAPESPDLNYLRGFSLFSLKRYPEALAAFGKVTPESRFYQDAVVHSAFILQEQGRSAEAVRRLEEAIALYPTNPELLYYLGTIHEEAERYEEALSALKRAIEKAPSNANFVFRLGVVYDKQKNKDASIEAMRRVIELDPKNANALNYLGYTFAEMGTNLDEAEQLIIEALKYKPDDGYITDSLGWVYYQKGDYPRALEYLKKAHELVPEDPTIMEHVGDAYLKLGEPAKALDFYERALIKKDKEPEELQEKIRRLKEGGP